MKVAVIGSGAAGAGAILGLLARGQRVSIDVFDAAEPIVSDLERRTDPRGWPAGPMRDIYARNARINGRSLPLPKSYFGFVPTRIEASGKKRIWRSAYRGGLTNFWGGTLLPLANEDFDGWPVTRSQMVPWYARVCDTVGVSGRADGLSEALDGFEPSNRPPIEIEPIVAGLLSAFAAGGVSAGVNRIALETRPGAENRCVFCGECLIGCFKGAPFTTAALFSSWVADGVLKTLSNERVTSINLENRRLRLEGANGARRLTETYDQIFLGAGCFGSARVLMASLGVSRAEMEDSRVVNLPLVATRLRAPSAPRDRGFGLTHGLLVLKDSSGKVEAQAQLYPTLPHFWRSLLPAALWPAAGVLGGPVRARVVWARIYLPPAAANLYQIETAGDAIRVERSKRPGGDAAAAAAVERFEQALAGSGYRPLSMLAHDGGSSSHYAAARPFRIGDNLVNDRFEAADGVYVIDSTAWPSAPAMSPTLTIMANAMRVAAEG